MNPKSILLGCKDVRLLSVFRKSKGEDTDANIFNIFEGIRTSYKGSTSGTDIVNE